MNSVCGREGDGSMLSEVERRDEFFTPEQPQLGIRTSHAKLTLAPTLTPTPQVRVIDGRIVVSELETDTPATEPAVEYRRVEEGELQCASPTPAFLPNSPPALTDSPAPYPLPSHTSLAAESAPRTAVHPIRTLAASRPGHSPPVHDRLGQNLCLVKAQCERSNT